MYSRGEGNVGAIRLPQTVASFSSFGDEDSECSAHLAFFLHQSSEQFLVLSLGSFPLLHEVSRGYESYLSVHRVLWPSVSL